MGAAVDELIEEDRLVQPVEAVVGVVADRTAVVARATGR